MPKSTGRLPCAHLGALFQQLLDLGMNVETSRIASQSRRVISREFCRATSPVSTS